MGGAAWEKEKGTAASALWDTTERAVRSVSEQMSAKITTQGQGLSEIKTNSEGRLSGVVWYLEMLMSTADAGNYTNYTNADNAASATFSG